MPSEPKARARGTTAWSAVVVVGAFSLGLAAGTLVPTERQANLAPAASLRPQATLVREAWVAAPHPESDLDSPAFWRGSEGQNWILVTAKGDHALHVLDAATGESILEDDGGLEPFRRPNGITVVGDVAFVVERDAQRVRVLQLPGLEFVAMLTHPHLKRPYGIASIENAAGGVDLFITDDLIDSDEVARFDPAFFAFVRHFRVLDGGTGWKHVRSFGESDGPGRLRKVESIAADAEYGRLLVADEVDQAVKVYSLDGNFSGIVLGDGHFRSEPEGIALLACGSEGYYVFTDQGEEDNAFHLHNRRDFSFVGSFRGGITTRTDGIALASGPVGSLDGALFAVHADRSMVAFDWTDVTGALGVPKCPEGRKGHP